MKKVILLSLLLMFVIGALPSGSSFAARKISTRKTTVTTSQLRVMDETIDKFTLKTYTKSLFSPEENEELINIKIRLDNQMLVKSDPAFAQIYYKAANLYKAREYKTEAIQCYQTIIENFGSTIYAQKAKKELSALGVKVAQ